MWGATRPESLCLLTKLNAQRNLWALSFQSHPYTLMLKVGVNIWAGGKTRAEMSLPERKVVLLPWGRHHKVPQTGGFDNRV